MRMPFASAKVVFRASTLRASFTARLIAGYTSHMNNSVPFRLVEGTDVAEMIVRGHGWRVHEGPLHRSKKFC